MNLNDNVVDPPPEQPQAINPIMDDEDREVLNQILLQLQPPAAGAQPNVRGIQQTHAQRLNEITQRHNSKALMPDSFYGSSQEDPHRNFG